ncbi:MAG TPA: sugar transferase [Pyrinomonadaceae bacterium]|jgi:undecaprenyl-phosphate galactose phosphotransferase
MLKNYPAYKWILAACDYTLLLVSWAAAILIRFYDVPLMELLSRPLVRTQGALILGYSFVWIVIFQHFGLYKLDLFMSFGRQLVAIGKSLVYGLLGLVLITFVFKRLDFVESRLVLAMFVGISIVLVMTFRAVVVRRLFPLASSSKILRRRVLIIGQDRTAKTVAAQIAYDETHGFEVVGFANDDAQKGERIFGEIENVGSLSELDRLVDEFDIDEIIIAESDVTHAALLTIIDHAQATRANVRLVSELYNIIPEKVLLEKYLGVPVVKLPQNYENTLFNVYKGVFDVVLTVVGLVLLTIPMAVIALLIKLTSHGRVLHTQTRIGKDCEPFTFYKFRTMEEGADDAIHKDFASQFIGGTPKGVKKMIDDPRVTRIGRFLRRTSLDELPQLFNVLTGEMSLVGPRPCMPYELDHYEEWHRRRLSVKPGCTGLWQVAGRSAVDFNDMVILDLFYIDNMSPLFDLRIILKTLPVMLLAKGGY